MFDTLYFQPIQHGLPSWSEPSLMQDYENASPHDIIHAHGMSSIEMPPRPYIRGAHKTQAEKLRELWNAAHPSDLMP